MVRYPITLKDCLWIYANWNFAVVIEDGIIKAFILEDMHADET